MPRSAARDHDSLIDNATQASEIFISSVELAADGKINDFLPIIKDLL